MHVAPAVLPLRQENALADTTRPPRGDGGGGRGDGARPGLPRAAAQQAVRQEDLLRFAGKGQVTLLHMADMHAQLLPLYSASRP